MKASTFVSVLAAAAVALVVGAPAVAKVPRATDYHSLLVSADNPKVLLLGTHQGLFRSGDGGHTWHAAGLAGEDAMNLVRAGQTIFMGGHDVFAESSNGGKTWRHVRPAGLPSLDVHGLAVDPRHPRTLFAQIASTGLYRSTNGARSFRLVSSDVNGMMMQVAVTPAGRLIVGDMSRGIFVSTTNGRHWLNTATGMVMGLAVDPWKPDRVLATGRGIAISNDAGRSWTYALPSKTMFGPIAWAPQVHGLVYAVGFDRSLWRSTDGGAHWQPVA